MVYSMRNPARAIASLGVAGARLFLFAFAASSAFSQSAPLSLPDRKVLEGITTQRTVQGVPYELAGKRIVFTNWYYIQPGDLDWRNAQDKSVYVEGNEGLFGARHVGINAPHGIRIAAEKPRVMGPIDRPHRMILRDGDVYKAWTDSDYYESSDAIHWQKKAALKLEAGIEDGLYHVFIDPSARPEERYKTVCVGHITRAQFDAFRARRPDDGSRARSSCSARRTR